MNQGHARVDTTTLHSSLRAPRLVSFEESESRLALQRVCTRP